LAGPLLIDFMEADSGTRVDECPAQNSLITSTHSQLGSRWRRIAATAAASLYTAAESGCRGRRR